jgi:rare lipoprotein A
MRFERIVKVMLLVGASLLLLNACAAKKPDLAKAPGPGRGKASQRPYTVNGRTYEPLQTHVGFVQTGVASWYGKDFHGKATSNGERYDMYAMTAAHKTLPLGVYVKVQNKENGKETVVRVNDRGPFVKGRIIDLSYAAAKQIGIDLGGTGSVRVEALGYRSDGKGGYKSPESYDSGNYTVQIGSFKEYSNAKRLGGEMNTLFGFSDVRMTAVNGDIFYRVYAGKFSSLNAAEAAEKKFAEHGYPGSFAVGLE